MDDCKVLRNTCIKVLEKFRSLNYKIATAESCTGGLMAASLTEIPGSSYVFDRGFITYSNNAKQDLLSVPENMLKQYGAVSSQVAGAMAKGVLKCSDVFASASITGIAGPGGQSAKKTVGLVFIAVANQKQGLFIRKFQFNDQGRDFIRYQTVLAACKMLLRYGTDA